MAGRNNIFIPDIESLDDENPCGLDQHSDRVVDKSKRSSPRKRPRKVDKNTMKPTLDEEMSECGSDEMDTKKHDHEPSDQSLLGRRSAFLEKSSSCSVLGFDWGAYAEAAESEMKSLYKRGQKQYASEPHTPSKSKKLEKKVVRKRSMVKRTAPNRSKSCDTADLSKMREAPLSERLEKQKTPMKRRKSNNDALLLLLKDNSTSRSSHETRSCGAHLRSENGKAKARKASSRSKSSSARDLAQIKGASSAERLSRRKSLKRSKSSDDDVRRSKPERRERSSDKQLCDVGKTTLKRLGLRRPVRRSMSSDCLTAGRRSSAVSSEGTVGEQRRLQNTKRSVARRRKSCDDIAQLLKEASDIDVEKETLVQDCRTSSEDHQGLTPTNETGENCQELIEDCENLIVNSRIVFAEKRKLSGRGIDFSHEGQVEGRPRRGSMKAAFLGKYLDEIKASLSSDDNEGVKSLCSTGNESVKTLSRRNKLKNRKKTAKGKTDDRNRRSNRRGSSKSALRRSLSNKSMNSTESGSSQINLLLDVSNLDSSLLSDSLEACEDICINPLHREISESSEKNSLLNTISKEHNDEDSDTEPDSLSFLSSEDDKDSNEITEALQFNPELDDNFNVSILSIESFASVETKDSEDGKETATASRINQKVGTKKKKKIKALDKEGEQKSKTKKDKRKDKKKSKAKNCNEQDNKKTTTTKKGKSSKAKLENHMPRSLPDNLESYPHTSSTVAGKITKKVGVFVSSIKLSLAKEVDEHQRGSVKEIRQSFCGDEIELLGSLDGIPDIKEENCKEISSRAA